MQPERRMTSSLIFYCSTRMRLRAFFAFLGVREREKGVLAAPCPIFTFRGAGPVVRALVSSRVQRGALASDKISTCNSRSSFVCIASA